MGGVCVCVWECGSGWMRVYLWLGCGGTADSSVLISRSIEYYYV